MLIQGGGAMGRGSILSDGEDFPGGIGAGVALQVACLAYVPASAFRTSDFVKRVILTICSLEFWFLHPKAP